MEWGEVVPSACRIRHLFPMQVLVCVERDAACRWAWGRIGVCYKMDLLHNLAFGALISATDPVGHPRTCAVGPMAHTQACMRA